MKRVKVFVFVFLAMATIVSCVAKDSHVLSVSGLTEVFFTQKDLETMDMIESEYINEDNEITVSAGVPIINVLTEAGVGDFTKVEMIASDGYSVEVTSEEMKGCTGCILTFNENNGWKAVMPGFAGKLQIKNVVELKAE